MQNPVDNEPELTDAERRLGFTVQTLVYPEDGYELTGLRAPGKSHLTRAVALTLGGARRARRRARGGGYLLEELVDETWRAAGSFDTVDELAASDVFRRAQAPDDDAGVATGATEEV